MENSPWLDPRFLFPVGVAAVGLILWFARLEYKTNANTTRQGEHEEDMITRVDELKNEHKEVKKAFYAHAGDTKVHHNEAMYIEFRAGIGRQFTEMERRFTGLDNTLQDISRKLDNRNDPHKTQG